MNTAYYNEFDPKAAATLRQLIHYGLIAPGDVDERSIEDVLPRELHGYTQCHFFAGFGIWSLALRMAGWPDSRPVWTGSCPCQPFSSAGKAGGFADERHLWPAFFHLIQHGKRPDVPLYGEQVASPDALAWLDLVCADLEAQNHTVRAFDLCAAGFGAPIIRQRLFWLACGAGQPLDGRRHGDARDVSGMERSGSAGLERFAGNGYVCGQPGRLDAEPVGSVAPASDSRGVACSDNLRHRGPQGSTPEPPSYGEDGRVSLGSSDSRGVACANGWNASAEGLQRSGQHGFVTEAGRVMRPVTERPGSTNGFWRDADWLICRDDKWRPVEPGTFPLAHGYPERMGILRGAGNAISPQVAASFIEVTKDYV